MESVLTAVVTTSGQKQGTYLSIQAPIILEWKKKAKKQLRNQGKQVLLLQLLLV